MLDATAIQSESEGHVSFDRWQQVVYDGQEALFKARQETLPGASNESSLSPKETVWNDASVRRRPGFQIPRVPQLSE
jgi:hypothetical protein